MFNSVQYVRDICRQRKIPISQLEKECGFANGYLNPKKMTKIPYDRALTIATYLGISVDCILTGNENKKSPPTDEIVLTEEERRVLLALREKGGIENLAKLLGITDK